MLINTILQIIMHKVKQSGSSSEEPDHKNKYQFKLDKQRKIIIDSKFDNGNINLIKQVSEFNYRLEAVPDTKNRSYQKKSWFYFRVSAPKGIKIKFNIENVAIYENMYEDKNWAKPFVKQSGKWKQIKDAFLSYRDEVILVFDHTFSNNNSPVYFCLSLPFSYDDSENYLQDIKYRVPDNIIYQDIEITKSYGQLKTHMLKITAKEDNPLISAKKPIILITARVHPGEVGASYCLMGMIDFLIRSCNLQSKLLTKLFEFVIFPIVNPDGIYQGNYRMDLNNYNLNRVYNDPSPILHPTVSKIKQIVAELLKTRVIMFHFDLHSHSSMKSAFIYGNACENITNQTQSEVFCKLLEQNCEIFRYGISQFGQRHMKMKDKGENMSKQGCARVVMSKMANIIYSYTVQTSIFPYTNRQPLLPVKNQNFSINEQNIVQSRYGYENITFENIMERYGQKHPLILDNMMLGSQILISILDILEKNPYSRFFDDTLENYRKQISQQLLQNEDRFKLLDIRAHQKSKMISKFIKEQFLIRYPKVWDFIANNKQFVGIEWPKGFEWFKLGPYESQKKKNRARVRTEVQENGTKQLQDFINPKNLKKNAFCRESISQNKKSAAFLQNYPLAGPYQLQLPQTNKALLEKQTKKLNTQRIIAKNQKKSCASDSIIKPESQIKQLSEISRLKQKQKESLNLPQKIIFQYQQRERREQRQRQKQQSKMENKRFPKNRYSLKQKHSNTRLIKKQSNSSKLIETIAFRNRNKSLVKNTCEDIVSKRKALDDPRNLQSLKIDVDGKEIDITPTKRDLLKAKYPQIKRKNIIRQDFKLPELKIKGNVCIGGIPISEEKRTTTMPDIPDQY